MVNGCSNRAAHTNTGYHEQAVMLRLKAFSEYHVPTFLCGETMLSFGMDKSGFRYANDCWEARTEMGRLLVDAIEYAGVMTFPKGYYTHWAPTRQFPAADEEVPAHVGRDSGPPAAPQKQAPGGCSLDSKLLPPAPAAGAAYANQWGIVVAPSSLNERTKTGQTDDSLLVADVAHAWLKDALALIYDKKAANTTPIFPKWSLAQYDQAVASSVKALGLQKLGICPHVWRHSGASNDRQLRRRTLAGVQKRGRWASAKSTARYEKEAMVLQQLKKMTQEQQATAKKISSSFGLRLVKALREQR